MEWTPYSDMETPYAYWYRIKKCIVFYSQGYDNYLISPDKLQKLLSRLAFEGLGRPFQPFIIGQRHVGPKMALSAGAKLVFYGENVAEYGNNMKIIILQKWTQTLYKF